MRVVTLAFRDGTVLRRCTTPHPHIPPPHPRAPAPAPHQHATLYRGVKPTLYWNTSSQSEEPCWTLTLTLIRRIRAGRSQTKKGASAMRPRLGWRPPRCTVRVRNCTRTLTRRTLYGATLPPSRHPALAADPHLLPPPSTHTHTLIPGGRARGRSLDEGRCVCRET